ncbi:MAG TPA: GIY-YIG nuclease family protein [Burkholderiales bacterium]|nr:GIY-YIG nuclease family protein [Burkholderiales bacterium]
MAEIKHPVKLMAFCLYIVADGKNSKVGITQRPFSERLSEYHTHNPNVQQIAVFESLSEEDARRIESAIKVYFKSDRVGKGKEWFGVDPTKMRALASSLVSGSIEKQSTSPILPLMHSIHVSNEAWELLEEIGKYIERDKTEKEGQKLLEKKRQAKAKYEILLSDTFKLGMPKETLDRHTVSLKDPPCVDIANCDPINRNIICESIRKNFLKFPDEDHVRAFYRLAPLGSSSHAAFCTAIASMPYIDHLTDEEWGASVQKMQKYANTVGWYCAAHDDWSWHYPTKTGLVLFQPKSSSDHKVKMFGNSFRKFVIEREKLLLASHDPPKSWDLVIRDVVHDASFPLDVSSWEDLYGHYLEPFELAYDDDDHPHHEKEAFKVLFEAWHKSKSQ